MIANYASKMGVNKCLTCSLNHSFGLILNLIIRKKVLLSQYMDLFYIDFIAPSYGNPVFHKTDEFTHVKMCPKSGE